MLVFLFVPLSLLYLLGTVSGTTDNNALHQYDVLHGELLRVTKFVGVRLKKLEKKLRTNILNTDIRRKRAQDEYIALNERVKNIYEGWHQAIATLDDGEHPVDKGLQERLEKDQYDYIDIQNEYYRRYFKAGAHLQNFLKKYAK
ncbi:hypothetical protein K7432_009315 [Basidiobolus ranarum]|uniref:Uncharacterized protein n=1 Tax=Basidiobolus ranarum TaxID=34480 RepID=A0ABR2VXD7_9FUNG